jgi:hypothetical protein
MHVAVVGSSGCSATGAPVHEDVESALFCPFAGWQSGLALLCIPKPYTRGARCRSALELGGGATVPCSEPIGTRLSGPENAVGRHRNLGASGGRPAV